MIFSAEGRDTICALSSAPGRGGISVIRLSGPEAARIARRIASRFPENPESHRIYLSLLKAPSSGEPIDEGLLSFFAEGHSFTGEETVEISVHGSPAIVEIMLSELVSVGARLARPGEFTFRAFVNGRIDLLQAEATLSLIESRSGLAAKAAVRNLRGAVSSDIKKIEEDLLWSLAQIEAGIDFSTEDIDPVDLPALEERLLAIKGRCRKLIDGYRRGRLLSEGLRVSLVGPPNAGKSSLFNALIEDDRAIVTDVPGTTRDVLEAQVEIDGYRVTFVDTAGIRETEELVERMGVERAEKERDRADLVLWVADSSGNYLKGEIHAGSNESSPETWLVHSKCDLLKADPRHLAGSIASDSSAMKYGLKKRIGVSSGGEFWVSARTGQGLLELKRSISELISETEASDAGVLMHARQVEGIAKIESSVDRAQKGFVAGESPELIAFELQEAVVSSHALLGKEFHEQVIDRVFKEFCLGK